MCVCVLVKNDLFGLNDFSFILLIFLPPSLHYERERERERELLYMDERDLIQMTHKVINIYDTHTTDEECRTKPAQRGRVGSG